jgi:hypothetical protein
MCDEEPLTQRNRTAADAGWRGYDWDDTASTVAAVTTSIGNVFQSAEECKNMLCAEERCSNCRNIATAEIYFKYYKGLLYGVAGADPGDVPADATVGRCILAECDFYNICGNNGLHRAFKQPVFLPLWDMNTHISNRRQKDKNTIDPYKNSYYDPDKVYSNGPLHGGSFCAI